MKIINPQTEFIIVRHSFLNGLGYPFKDAYSESLLLQNYIEGREVVVCFEGDLHQIEGTNEPIFTHRNYIRVNSESSIRFRKMGIIATLDEVIESILTFKKENPGKKLIFCVELKKITKRDTIKKTMLKFKDKGISEMYFDSFYGYKLDEVSEINNEIGSTFEKSLHVYGNIFGIIISPRKPKYGYDILTVPMVLSFGKVGKPIIYGTVNSHSSLRKIGQSKEAFGAYIRFKEGNPLLLLFNSIRNTEWLRGKHVMDPKSVNNN